MAAGVAWPNDIPVPPFRAYSSPAGFAGLLAEAGFSSITVHMLSWHHQVGLAEWWEEVYLSGVGSNGVVIGRQDIATVARIENEFCRVAARYAVGDAQIALPVAAVLASATR
jgi:hypothetical protein